MGENACCFHFQLSADEVSAIDALSADAHGEPVGENGRLCWRADPLRMLDFE
jgi:hypothetical protein